MAKPKLIVEKYKDKDLYTATLNGRYLQYFLAPPNIQLKPLETKGVLYPAIILGITSLPPEAFRDGIDLQVNYPTVAPFLINVFLKNCSRATGHGFVAS